MTISKPSDATKVASVQSQQAEREALLDNAQAPALTLGERIIALRLKHGFSQRELARRASVTNSTLSTIEQGKVSPSVASLEKILNAFPISFEAFFSSSNLLPQSVFKPADLAQVNVGASEMQMLALGDSSIEGCYFVKHQLAPHSSTQLDWLNPHGVVAALLCEGELTVVVEGKKQHLVKGDCLHFSLQRDHQIINDTDFTCLLACSFLPH